LDVTPANFNYFEVLQYFFKNLVTNIIKLKKTYTIFLFAFNLMYVNSKQSNPPFFDQNSPFVLRVISSFELQIVTIINFKPHKLLNSSILNSIETTFCSLGLNFDGATFCSPNPSYNGSTFCFPIVYFNETTFCFLAS